MSICGKTGRCVHAEPKLAKAHLDQSKRLQGALQIRRRDVGHGQYVPVGKLVRAVEEQQDAHLVGAHIELVLAVRKLSLEIYKQMQA